MAVLQVTCALRRTAGLQASLKANRFTISTIDQRIIKNLRYVNGTKSNPLGPGNTL